MHHMVHTTHTTYMVHIGHRVHNGYLIFTLMLNGHTPHTCTKGINGIHSNANRTYTPYPYIQDKRDLTIQDQLDKLLILKERKEIRMYKVMAIDTNGNTRIIRSQDQASALATYTYWLSMPWIVTAELTREN